MDVIIRNMEEKDIRAVQLVAKLSWNATYEGIIPLEIQSRFLKLAYSVETLKKRLSNSFLYVAQYKNKIIGFANFSPVTKDGETELGAIYLFPKYQGKGIGTALLNYGISNLQGVKEVYLHVEKNNTVGISFYQAKGFQKVDEFDDYLFEHKIQTIRMCLRVHE